MPIPPPTARIGRRRARWVTAALVTIPVGALAFGVLPSRADDPTPPEPPSTGTEIPQTYFGPPASESFSENNESLVGPVELLKAGSVNAKAGTTTLPLYRGHDKDGTNVWFILTDTTDQDNADALGLNFSAKLAYANVGSAVREAWLQADTSLIFETGAVDFSPRRVLVPGDAPNAFPPKVARPGSVGDATYTPYVQVVNAPGTPIYNAPVVAYDVGAKQLKFCKGDVDHSLVHDRVVRICPKAPSNGQGTVTLDTTQIFSFAKPSTYISTEASDPVVATLDSGTFAPAIGDLPVGRDDSAFSAIERLFVTANGPTGAKNPQRQGLNSAVLGEGDPLHVIGGIPTVSNDYSPAWDLNLGFWTDKAIRKGYRARIIDEFQYLDLVAGGHITGEDGAPFGSTEIVVNCPIVARFL
ncbi:MAG: hypothetical protein H0U77_10635 [Nocardioidaceae bacterium]|nr:hypothetical protein [Nocardioidaceae bacterium]